MECVLGDNWREDYVLEGAVVVSGFGIDSLRHLWYRVI